MTLNEFIRRYAGIGGVGNTTGNKGQCVGLVMVWAENLGKTHFWGDAKDLFKNAPDAEWNKIKNSPDAYPVAGDIMVWNGRMGGGAGHTAVVLFSNKEQDSFTVIEQNNPDNEPGLVCEITTFKSWVNVTGWLRPKGYSEDTDLDCISLDEFIKVKEERDEKDRKLEECRDDKAKLEKDHTLHVEQLQKSLSELNQVNSSLMRDKETLLSEKSALEVKIEPLETKYQQSVEQSVALEERFANTREKLLNLEKKLAEEKAKVKVSDFTWIEIILRKLGGR